MEYNLWDGGIIHFSDLMSWLRNLFECVTKFFGVLVLVFFCFRSVWFYFISQFPAMGKFIKFTIFKNLQCVFGYNNVRLNIRYSTNDTFTNKSKKHTEMVTTPKDLFLAYEKHHGPKSLYSLYTKKIFHVFITDGTHKKLYVLHNTPRFHSV